jgi:hypothetical protein
MATPARRPTPTGEATRPRTWPAKGIRTRTSPTTSSVVTTQLSGVARWSPWNTYWPSRTATRRWITLAPAPGCPDGTS